MRIVHPAYEIEHIPNGIEAIKRIERAGRTCYKSEDKITEASAERFVAMIIKRGHHSVLEHEWASVRFVCNRGVSHEIVRHRLASYSQESTRYCNYAKHAATGEPASIGFIPNIAGLSVAQVDRRLDLYRHIEDVYTAEVAEGISPQQARDNLPICLKTELVMTANFREWRHFFQLRTAAAAHPQMREIARPLLNDFRSLIPVIFDDVGVID